MKAPQFVLVVTAVSVSLLVELATDFVDAVPSPDGEPAKEKTCKAILGDLMKRQLGGISACSKTMKFKNGKDKSKKMNCILKCIMIKEGILDKEGYLSADQVDVLLEREFPPSLIERANKTFFPCLGLAEGKLDPNPATDEFCKTYDPLLKCFMGNLPNLCA